LTSLRSMMRLATRAGIVILSLLIIAAIASYMFQDRLIFQSIKLDSGHRFTFDQPFEEFFIPAPGGDTLNALWFNPAGPSRGLILYFHGNRGNLQRWGNYAVDLTANGYEVVMIDYRGYGKSTGKPTEASLYADAETVLQWALARGTFDKVIIYGRSLGAAVASRLATTHPPDLLVLETPFDELRSVIWPFFKPVTDLLPWRYEFSNKDHLKRVTSRKLIIHGTDDSIVPLSAALRLKPMLGPRDEFVIIPGGAHRNLRTFPAYHEKLAQFLQAP